MAPPAAKSKKSAAGNKSPAAKKSPTGAAKKAAAAKKASSAASKKAPAAKKKPVAAKKPTITKKSAPAQKPAAAKKKPTAAAAAAAAKKPKAAATAAAKKKPTAAAAAAKKKPTAAAAKKPTAAAAKKAAAKKPAAAKKKTAASAAKKPVTGKRGLKGQAAPNASDGRVGQVDPAANLSADATLAEVERDLELDVMLSQIDVSKNMDKFFIIQAICEPPSSSAKKAKTAGGKKASASSTEQFYFFTRWGRTGTSGSCSLEGPFDELDEVSTLFGKKFLDKTGNQWDVDDHEDRYIVRAGKYTCLRPNATQVKEETWQYWVDDKVDGKEDGWYDYDQSAAAVVEQLHTEFQTNPGLSQRVVASGMWMYHVDLTLMTQTNVTHPGRKIRHIRRNPGRSLPNTPPGAGGGKASKGKGKGGGAAAAATPTAAASTSAAEVDKACPKANNKGVSVCAGHDVKLNQTNIAANNNKFYVLQMCRDGGRKEWFVWCRWGRVGEMGSTAELGPFKVEDDAGTAFSKKFRDKTGNKWADAQSGGFKAVAGKYELIETDNTDTTAAASMVASGGGGGASSSSPPARILPCTLKRATKELVELVFSSDMFKSAMQTMNVDVKKMPLGQLSAAQVQRGYAVLEELENAMGASGANRAALLETLSARFYQVIPHAFGRMRPPVIDSEDVLSSKVEMLNVLQDIGEAQTMLAAGKGKGNGAKKGAAAAAVPPPVPHPTDVNYGMLNADLELVSPQSHEYKTIKRYMENTKPSYGSMDLYDVWSVDRQGEAKRFAAHDKIVNRKLLWHGTNVAVVAAIIKSGLRIMPHSGGRVGKGIYLASENGKSRQYVRPAYGAKGAGSNVGVMFLCEAALGKEASITVDDHRLTTPPKGFDSVVARGMQEPDPSKDVVLKIEGKSVTVPQGKPKTNPAYQASRFGNSEYLVYKESQQRIRYMLTVKC